MITTISDILTHPFFWLGFVQAKLVALSMPPLFRIMRSLQSILGALAIRPLLLGCVLILFILVPLILFGHSPGEPLSDAWVIGWAVAAMFELALWARRSYQHRV